MAQKVDLFRWPMSQGCIGCSYAHLVQSMENSHEQLDSAYICLAENRKDIFCDNPDAL